MTMRDNSTATGKTRKRKVSTGAVATEEGGRTDRRHHRGVQHPAAVAARGAFPLWTEEMHSSFLDRMEAAFVHDILFCGPAGHAAASHRLHHQQQRQLMATMAAATPSLDRYVPDIAESTRDGHGGALPSPASCPGVKRRGGRNTRRDGCTPGADISDPRSRRHRPFANGPTATDASRLHHPQPRKEIDGVGDDQVVPLLEMPEPCDVRQEERRSSKDLI